VTEDYWQYPKPAAIVAKAVVGSVKLFAWRADVFPDLARSST